MVGHCEDKELLSVHVLLNHPVPAASWDAAQLPLPSFLLDVRDRDSIQCMETPLAAQSYQIPQASGQRSHQPAVAVTSIPHAWAVGSRVCSSLTVSSIPISSGPD